MDVETGVKAADNLPDELDGLESSIDAHGDGPARLYMETFLKHKQHEEDHTIEAMVRTIHEHTTTSFQTTRLAAASITADMRAVADAVRALQQSVMDVEQKSAQKTAELDERLTALANSMAVPASPRHSTTSTR